MACFALAPRLGTVGCRHDSLRVNIDQPADNAAPFLDDGADAAGQRAVAELVTGRACATIGVRNGDVVTFATAT
jgi:hypothetical protein